MNVVANDLFGLFALYLLPQLKRRRNVARLHPPRGDGGVQPAPARGEDYTVGNGLWREIKAGQSACGGLIASSGMCAGLLLEWRRLVQTTSVLRAAVALLNKVSEAEQGLQRALIQSRSSNFRDDRGAAAKV